MLNGVVDRLRLRMSGMKCVALNSVEDRALVDAAVQEAQQQGATVSQNHCENCAQGMFKMSVWQERKFTLRPFLHFSAPQLVQSCAAPPSGAQYPPTVLCGAVPSSPFVVNPSPGPLLPLMTFRTHTEAVTLGEDASVGVDAGRCLKLAD